MRFMRKPMKLMHGCWIKNHDNYLLIMGIDNPASILRTFFVMLYLEFYPNFAMWGNKGNFKILLSNC